jgi:predicted TIM-barrel fold metal-dependent hydrolase
MIIDSHVHIFSFPSFRDLSNHIRTMEDAIAFRTRYPELYKRNATDEPIDNTDELIRDMDKNGIDFAIVQARVGRISNDMVADAAKRHPDRMAALARLGHDQQSGGYLDDPGPVRDAAPAELDRCLGTLGMKGVGETSVRAFSTEIHPERIAKDIAGIMRIVEKHQVPIQFPTAWTQFRDALYYGDPIWVDEVAGRHPTVPIILTKMGRSITRYFESAMVVAMRNVNVYFDVVGTNPEHLRLAIDKIGADRIMFGTDWSTILHWLRVPATLHQIHLKVLDDARLTNAEREQVLWKTAAKIFKLDGLTERSPSGSLTSQERLGIGAQAQEVASGTKPKPSAAAGEMDAAFSGRPNVFIVR